MKFRCERDLLLDALSTAGRAVTTRGGSLAVLACVHLDLQGDRLRLTGSDLDLTISIEITVGGEQDGRAAVPSKLFADIVRAFKGGAVTVEVEGDQASLAAGRSDFSVRTMPAEEFPQLPAPPDEAVTIDAAAFASGLKQVVPAASADDSRPILTGVLLASEGSGLRLVATDSYRLSVRDIEGASVLDAEQSVLVPSRALGELTRLLADHDEVVLRLGKQDASFEVGDSRLTTRLIEGDFPNYRGLIPENHPNRLTVAREPLLEAVRRVRLLAQEATPLRLMMSADGLELVAVTQDVGQAHESVDASYEGEDLTVAFNADYLLDGLEVTPGEELTLETVDSLKPALLRPVDRTDFLYLLMPVRVS